MKTKQTHSHRSLGSLFFAKTFASLLLLLAASAVHAGQGPQPTICTRACWAARAPTCGITQMGGLTRATIHHTAGTGDYSSSLENSKAVLRGIQNYHINNGWCDIAYHFLVDAAGNIFEGRSGSWSSLPRGTHDACNNNSFGFTALGYYHPPYNQPFTSATRNAMEAVIAWRMPSAWSPYGSGTYCSANVGFMDGHYKVVATACPGDGIIPQIPAMRDGVNNRKNGGTPAVHDYLGVLASDGTLSAKDGPYGGWVGLLNGVSAFQIEGGRIAALQNGNLFVKDGGLYGGWVNVSGPGVVKFQLRGDRIGVIYSDGTLACKDGMYGTWFNQLGGVSALYLEGNRIGALANGVLYVKEGLQGGWTTQTSGGMAKFQLSGDRIAVLTSGGLLSCKDGLYGSWFDQLGGVSDFHISGNRISVVAGGTVYVKDGLQGSWTTQTGGGFKQVRVLNDRIAALHQDGTLIAKEGLYGSWYTLMGGVARFQLDGDRIGVLTGSGMVTLKYGLTGAWLNQTGDGHTAFQLATWNESTPAPAPQILPAAGAVATEVIVDNASSGFSVTGTWSTGTSATDKYGADYRFRSTAAVTQPAQWQGNLTAAGNYQVMAWWAQGSNRSASAPYVVYHSGGSTTVNKNQQTGGGAWQSLGVFNLNSGINSVQLSCWTTTGYIVLADAIRWLPQ